MADATTGHAMAAANLGKPRGLLNLKAGRDKFQLARHPPGPELAFFIEHYWVVRWDLRGQAPHVQESLSHPSVHLVLEKAESRIVGVVTGKFSRVLEGAGRVFGVKFRPGGFYPFVRSPVSAFTDRMVRLRDVLGAECVGLEAAVLAVDDDARMISLTEAFLLQRLPAPDENVELVNRVVQRIMADREVTKVDGVVDGLGITKRTLERLFSRYVGVSPKWVIRRYRLQKAVEQLADGKAVDWPGLALDLGYFDQAHFIKDFKAIVGKTPLEYARSIAGAL